MPYDQAAEVLQSVGQVAISGSTVWRLTQKWGQRLAELEKKEQEQANATRRETRFSAGKSVKSGAWACRWMGP